MNSNVKSYLPTFIMSRGSESWYLLKGNGMSFQVFNKVLTLREGIEIMLAGGDRSTKLIPSEFNSRYLIRADISHEIVYHLATLIKRPTVVCRSIRLYLEESEKRERR